MKNQLSQLFIAFIISTLLTGCFAAHFGTTTGSASLNAPNFVYKKQGITGQSQASYVFGIGGMDRTSLISEAKQNMLKNNPLHQNQALANVTYSYKHSFYFLYIYVTTKCNVSADVVEFGNFEAPLASAMVQNSMPPASPPAPSTLMGSTENKTIAQKPEAPKKVEEVKAQPTPVPVIQEEEVTIKTNPDAPIYVGDKVLMQNNFETPTYGIVKAIQNGLYTVEYDNAGKPKKIKLYKNQLEKVELQ